MIRKLLIIALLFSMHTSLFGQSQDYFLGKRTYCGMPEDNESKTRYKLGLDCINQNLYIGAANQIFQDLIKKDSTFCDAWFFAGYTFRMSNMNLEAVTMYYMADSLAQNKSIEFKQNLAYTSMLLPGGLKLSRKKFTEMTTFFPQSPEGFYGIALTSTMIGDFDLGLKNINIAEEKYQEINKDAQLIKAILLSLNEKYKESLGYFEAVKSKFSKDDSFNGHYALSLYEVSTLTHDEKMMKKAIKHYEKVKDKNKLTDYIKSKFENK